MNNWEKIVAKSNKTNGVKFLEIQHDENKVYAIEQILPIKSGARIIYRVYDTQNECGGFQMDLSISGASVDNVKMATNFIAVLPDICKSARWNIVCKAIDNKVPVKYQFKQVSNLF